VQEIITKTLLDATRVPFAQERIDGILHQIELSEKNIKGAWVRRIRHVPTMLASVAKHLIRQSLGNFGLNMALNMATGWIHGADTLDMLDITKHITQLKSDLQANPSLFQDLVREYFVDNKVRCCWVACTRSFCLTCVCVCVCVCAQCWWVYD
jgi:Zn-dependent M16 (insulinase) family peptidase